MAYYSEPPGAAAAIGHIEAASLELADQIGIEASAAVIAVDSLFAAAAAEVAFVDDLQFAAVLEIAVEAVVACLVAVAAAPHCSNFAVVAAPSTGQAWRSVQCCSARLGTFVGSTG